MNHTRARIISFITAVLTAFLAYYYIDEMKASQPVYVSVVRTVMSIPEGTKITSDMITVDSVVNTDIIQNAAVSPDDVIGKFTKTDLLRGEQIPSDRLVSQGDNTVDAFSYKIPKGMRTVTISVNSTTSVAGLLRVGDHVDIMISYSKQDEATNTSQNVTKYMADNIEIAALDKVITKSDIKDQNGNTVTTSFTTVTMFVTPEQAEALAWGESNGSIILTLRAPGDDANPSHEDFTSKVVDGL